MEAKKSIFNWKNALGFGATILIFYMLLEYLPDMVRAVIDLLKNND